MNEFGDERLLKTLLKEMLTETDITNIYKAGVEFGTKHGYNEGYTDGLLKDKHKYRESVPEGSFLCRCGEFAMNRLNVCAEHRNSDDIPYLKESSNAKPSKIGNVRI